MTDYDLIRQTCLKEKVLWEDPDFPATQASVFYHQTPPFHFEWKRSKDIYRNPAFIKERDDVFDVSPGKLGDRWMVSCLGVLYLTRGLFYRVVPADQKMDEIYTGVFRFRLWWCGTWLEVLVDDRLPTVNGKLVFLQSNQTEQMWPALLEKAYAKLHGSYEALKYGTLLDGLAELTGGVPDSIDIGDLSGPLTLKSLIKQSNLITAYTSIEKNDKRVMTIQPGMNYLVCNVEAVASSKGTLYMVRVRRPVGLLEADEPHVVLSFDLWNTIPSHEKDRFLSTRGTWLLYNDFVKTFGVLEIVHIDVETCRAEPYLTDKQKWQLNMYASSWRRGVTAGGCRNFAGRTMFDFFHTNPQIQIVLEEADNLVISLNQHSITDPKVIGFSIYVLDEPATGIMRAAFFQKTKSVVNSQYTNSRQVTLRTSLQSGTYLVVPTTFEPREEASFTLRILSGKSLVLDALDNVPHITKSAIIKAPLNLEANNFAQYEAVFLQLADENKTLDPFALQELLDACLPNDYIKSCACIETCRQIVLSFDKKDMGRISLADFKDLMCSLKHWQVVFKSHALEKMGVIRAERFRDALSDVGFEISEKVLALMVLRYIRKDGMLRFGDFVSAVMHLYRAFEMFDKVNPRTDSPSADLAEWLRVVFMC